ncbi:MAG TPA: hypothetical protein VLQ89_00865 [Candidatus Binatia bacterium]|nr:hypothetical protein [Candidatus Binatia bacterium]
MNCPDCDCYCPPDAEACSCGHRFPVPDQAPPTPFTRQKEAARTFVEKVAGSRRQVFRLAMLLSLMLWLLSLLFVKRLPGPDDMAPQLFSEPVQTRENVPPPFRVKKNKLTYIVTPLFHYELSGLVVSQHRSDSLLDVSHRRWQDYLNIKDLCVVWGKNIRSGVYRKMKFWNRDFTCMCEFPDGETAALFSDRHLSNNHLLCADKALSRRILAVRPGDQIYFRGYLASYSQPANQFERGTSTVRDDSGNGACETVFVTDFMIWQRANRAWHAINSLAFLATIAFMLAMLLL